MLTSGLRGGRPRGAVTATAGMAGLAWGVRRLPPATAYAVWVGAAARLTVAWAIFTGVGAYSWLKLVFIAGIVGCSAALQALGASEAATRSPPGGRR